MALTGQAVVSIWHDIADVGRDEFYWWHLHEHMPERVAIPGFNRGRRYIAEEGKPEFFTLYEASVMETLSGQEYLARLNNPTTWTLSTVKYFLNVARAVQSVRYSAGSGMGGFLLTLCFEVDGSDDFAESLQANVLAQLAATRGITGVHLCQTNLAASDTRTKERDQRDGGTDMPGWTLLIEAARRAELDQVLLNRFNPKACRDLGMIGDIEPAIFRLEYVCT